MSRVVRGNSKLLVLVDDKAPGSLSLASKHEMRTDISAGHDSPNHGHGKAEYIACGSVLYLQVSGISVKQSPMRYSWGGCIHLSVIIVREVQ
jgi:hypothetical protein